MRSNCFIAILTIFLSFILRGQQEARWKYFGPKETNEQVKGMIKALWVDENNLNHVLAGSSSGGLFRTDNALGDKPIWTNITDTYQGMVFGVSGIAVKPQTNGQVIYISTGGLYGNGILKTDNGGKTWQHVGPGGENDNLLRFDGLVMNPENSSEMIVYGEKEIYITRNDWMSHERIEMPADKINKEISFCDADFAPFEPGKFYVCTRTNNMAEAQMLLFENYGRNMKDLTPADIKSDRIEVCVLKNEKQKGRFYAVFGHNQYYLRYFNGKAFSSNLNTQAIVHAFAAAYWNLELAVNHVDTNIIYIGLTEISRSVNGGKSFEKIASYSGHNTHADVRAMSLLKSSHNGENDFLFVGNDGGVSLAKKYDPVEWKSLNGSGLDVTQFWGISVAQSDTFFVSGGTQDNGGYMITENSSDNTMAGCGDGYLAAALDVSSAVIECNPPSMYYHNLKSGQKLYLAPADRRFDTRRPIVIKDSAVYVGYGNIWTTTKRELEKGNAALKKFNDIPLSKNAQGGVRNEIVRAMAIGEMNSALISYKNPNWNDPENSGKLFFCGDLSKNEWKDITSLAYHNDFVICQWSEISALEIDAREPNKFYFICRDIYHHENCRIYEMTYYSGSHNRDIREIGHGLPKLGFNKLKIDKFSNVLYLAADNGVYYSDLNNDSITWNKLNGFANKLPNAMVYDVDINYVSNSLFAGTYGRGVWHTQLVGTHKSKRNITGNKIEKKAIKVDGKLSVRNKITYAINSKLILTKGSKIYLGKKSKLIIRNKTLVRNELNHVVNIEEYLVKHKSAQLIYKND